MVKNKVISKTRRANGEGSIVQRKDGRCVGNITIGYDDNGTQLKLSEQPDLGLESEFFAKKEQPEHKCSACYHMAEHL